MVGGEGVRNTDDLVCKLNSKTRSPRSIISCFCPIFPGQGNFVVYEARHGFKLQNSVVYRKTDMCLRVLAKPHRYKNLIIS